MNNISRLVSFMLMAACSWSVAKADNWMSRISDNAYFAQVSIPGTHDAGTGEGFTWGALADAFGRTQQLSLAEQWHIGVRAFDLRPSVSDGKLVVFHGVLQTNISFADALKVIADSLRANPSETAVVIIRHENDNGSDFSTWCTLMREMLKSNLLDGIMAEYNPQATMGDMRGKLLLLSRDQYDSKPTGGFITGWTHSDVLSDELKPRITSSRTTGILYVQDFYDVTAEGAMTKKLTAIEQILKITTRRHLTSIIQQTWAINHASGYTQSASTDGIRSNAAQTNKFFIDYLSQEEHYGPAGIVMMDFAGTDKSGSYNTLGAQLVKAVIENNFHYTPMERKTTEITVSLSDGLNTDNGAIFDLQGRKIGELSTANNKLPRGIFIVKDGRQSRKVMLK